MVALDGRSIDYLFDIHRLQMKSKRGGISYCLSLLDVPPPFQQLQGVHNDQVRSHYPGAAHEICYMIFRKK